MANNTKEIKKWMDNLEKEFGIKIRNKHEFKVINKK